MGHDVQGQRALPWRRAPTDPSLDGCLDTLAAALYVTADGLLKAYLERVPARSEVAFVARITDAELFYLANQTTVVAARFLPPDDMIMTLIMSCFGDTVGVIKPVGDSWDTRSDVRSTNSIEEFAPTRGLWSLPQAALCSGGITRW